MPKTWGLPAAALLVGVLNAVMFVVFEWVVDHGTDYIWNDLTDSDSVRWRVVPLAIGASIAFALVVRAARQPRLVPPHTDPLAGEEDAGQATLGGIGLILVVGAASLLAGASLGPEASLVAASAGLGAWIAGRAGTPEAARLLVLSSIGALLVAFLGSLVPVAIPLLMLNRQEKKLTVGHVLPPVAASLGAYGALYAIEGHAEGYGTIPAGSDFDAHDFLTALVLGACGVVVAELLKWLIKRVADINERIDARWPWPASAALFGAVLGVLYLLGGESVQFSGSAGVGILLRESADEGSLALAGLVAVKLLATGWSITIGYRGGLVFPAVYAGVAMSLLVGSVAGGLAGPGATVGSIGGILTAMTSPVLAVVMVLALTPVELIGLALAGTAGAVGAEKLRRMI